MRITDLEHPRFSQAEVLRLIPGLKPWTMQNWDQRRLIGRSEDRHPGKGRGPARLYSAVGVIILSAMHSATKLGIGPANAREMADQIAWCAIDLWGRAPDEAGANGERKIVLDFGKLAMYRRGYVTMTAGRHTMEVLSEPVVPTRHLHRLGRTVYLVIEIDLIVIDLLNRMHRFVVGLDPLGGEVRVDRPRLKGGRR